MDEGPVVADRERLRRRDRRLAILLSLLFFLSILPFATVHAPWRLVLASAAGVGGFLALAATTHLPTPSRARLWVGAGALAALLVMALPLLPVPAALGALLQPGFGPTVDRVLSVVGPGLRPLALDPWEGVLEWAVACGLVLLALGFSRMFRSYRRARRTAAILVSSGVVLVAIFLVHQRTGATHIWWGTGVPASAREAFFAPFVNPNHGGIACAALLPLALALVVARRSDVGIVGWILASIVLVAGVVCSGSRGAVLALATGSVVLALLSGRRIWRWVLAIVAVILALVIGYLGPRTLALALTAAVSPDTLTIVEGGYSDLLTGRAALWQEAGSVVRGAPLLGVGPGGFDDADQMARTLPAYAVAVHAHSDPLQIAAEHGLPVLLLWVAVLVGLAMRALGVARRHAQAEVRLFASAFLASAAALFAASLVDFPLRIGALSVLAALQAGTLLGLGADADDPGPERARCALVRLPAVAFGLLGVAVGWRLLSAPLEHTAWGSSSAALTRAALALEEARRDPEAAATFLDRAERGYREAARRRPAERAALQALGRFLEARGDDAAALDAWMAASAVHPSLPWPWRDLARFYRRQGEHDLAEIAWARMLDCGFPPDREIHDALVLEVLLGPGDPVVTARRVLPDRPEGLRAGARVLSDMGYEDEAERLLRQAAVGDDWSRFHLASFLVDRGRPAEALPLAEDPRARCWPTVITADALLALGRWNEAVVAYDLAIGRCPPNDLRSRIGLARARVGLGDVRGARSLDALVDEQPENARIRRLAIQAWRSQGRLDRVRIHLEALVNAGLATPAERRALAEPTDGRSLPAPGN
ncbi:MAG: O-antigen ligase family protein [Deltaproteobacteria bacterium]|nr:O-antigen ligase family protein [Deltaproteobacteria bacterium]